MRSPTLSGRSGTPLLHLLLAAILTAALVPPLSAAAARQAPSAAPAATPPDAAALAAELDALFAEAYPAGEPGAAVLVRRGEETLLRKGYGMADLEMGVAVDPSMVFRLGSITKQITGAAILLLAAEGALELDDTVGELLPEYEGPAAGVTLHQLLTHTGGVPSYTADPTYLAGMREDVTVEQMIERFREKPLDFEPGTDWAYSNSGYFLLGAVIEEVSGTTYEDFVERRIFEPLGMEGSLYGKVSEVVPGRVEGYQGAAGEGGTGYENAAYLSMTQPYAAGSLLSTVDDLALWMEALEDERLLPDDLRRLLWTPAELPDGRSTGYGYGLGVTEYQGHPIHHHGGGINGFVTYLLRVPDEDLTVAVLSNNQSARPGPTPLGLRTAALALGAPLDERPSVAVDPQTLDEYVGVYLVEEDPEGEDQVRVVTREGERLFTQRTGGSKQEARFSAPDTVYYPDGLTTARFERGPGGEVTVMVMTPTFGPQERAPKTDRPLPEERRAVEIDPSLLDAYTGVYEIAPGFRLTLTREGDRLFAQATGQPRFEVFPESETRFFLREVDAVIELHPDEDGTVRSLTLHQGGQEIPAERVD